MLANPYLTKLVFDRLETGAPMSQVGMLVLAMIGLAVASGIFRFSVRRTIIWMSRRLEYDLRGELVAHLLRLSPSYYDKNRTGDIMARVTNDLEAVRMMIGPGIMHICNTIVIATGGIAMMIVLSPKLTLIALVPAMLLPISWNQLHKRIHTIFDRIQQCFSHLTAVVQENLAGQRVIKAYRQEDNEAANFESLSQEYVGLNLGLGRLHATFFPIIRFIAAGLQLTVLYFGGREVIAGNIELSTIVAFFLYLGMLMWPLLAIAWTVSLYQRGTASLDRINKILFTEPEIRNLSNESQRDRIHGKIEFRNLTFGYDDNTVLSDISLIVKPGQTLGIVGPTGSGKSTLVSLLARMYSIEPGQLFIDDIDINDWELSALRRQIGFVAQEPFLFSATVADNIRFGVDTCNFEQVEEIAEMAALAKDIDEFPDGYDTMVGERGITLSGGQKQRTAIARAVLTEPPILILDDATASVDTETEHEISVRLRARTSELTTLVVSHRISSVKDADLIIYLDNGRIVARGTHEQLLRLGGAYAGLYRSQLLAEEIESL